jgi:hypothetical protein
MEEPHLVLGAALLHCPPLGRWRASIDDTAWTISNRHDFPRATWSSSTIGYLKRGAARTTGTSFSHRLVPQKLSRNLSIGAWVVLLLTCVPIPLAAGTDWQTGFVCVAIAMVLAWPVVHTGLVGGVLIALKWYLDWNFRIVIFRRNSRRFGYAHKSIVMATCGKYGQVLVIGDDSLERTDEDYGEWRESSQGPWLQVFSEMGNTLEPDAFLHNWQRQVIIELEIADFAIFDWAEDLTDNMRWELMMAAERLSNNRILIVYNDEIQQQVQELLATLSCSTPGSIERLMLSRKRDDQYIWPINDEFAGRFRNVLHQMMLQLSVEPRKPCGERNRGTWPIPRESAI